MAHVDDQDMLQCHRTEKQHQDTPPQRQPARAYEQAPVIETTVTRRRPDGRGVPGGSGRNRRA